LYVEIASHHGIANAGRNHEYQATPC
jgi:hypothetical protein